MRTCTIDACDRKHEARGLCKLHWTRQYAKAPTYLIRCAWCDKPHQSARRLGKYCSDRCKAASYTKATSCTVPPSHPSRIERKISGQCRVWIRDCTWCGRTFAGRMPHSTDCSPRCARKRHKVARRARERGAQGTYTWSQVIHLWLLFDKRCAYCLTYTDQPDPDHVVPLSRGGHNGIGNILPCCRDCNGSKSNHTLVEWAALRITRRQQARITTWSPTDQRYAHLHAGILTQAA